MSLYQAFNRSVEQGRTVERSNVINMEIARDEAIMARIQLVERGLEAITVLSHRIAGLEARLMSAEKSLANYSGNWGDDYIKNLGAGLNADPVEKVEGPKFEIPDDLMYNRTNYTQKPANKTPDKVARRWAIWKAQYESGMKILQIAKMWGCDHGSVAYARSKNWQASTGWHSR